MNTLLLFFAFPIAIIIFSIVLQKLLHNPITVAALVFAVFIVLTFSVFDQNFLIATLIYTVLAYIAAIITNYSINTNEKTIDDEDNVMDNNCDYMYNRRCKRI